MTPDEPTPQPDRSASGADPVVVPGAGVPPHVIINGQTRRSRRDVPAQVRRARRARAVTNRNHVRITRVGSGPAGPSEKARTRRRKT